MCYVGDSCTNRQRILRASSAHTSALRKYYSDTLSAHKIVSDRQCLGMVTTRV